MNTFPNDHGRNAARRSFFVFALASVLFVTGCAMGPRLQPEINQLALAGHWEKAAERIRDKNATYGKQNSLLYYLDRGMVEHSAGHLNDSIQSFEQAKLRFEQLYTQSLTKNAASWVVNDYAQPYRGTDYEYVLINVFQALNYVQKGDINEALVEARDLDNKFRVVEEFASRAQRPKFDDNGFARMFMGLLYEATGTGQGHNDAWIAYRQALALYDGYYGGAYVPALLQERLIAMERKFRGDNLRSLEQRFPESARRASTPGRKSVVYLIHAVGFAPVKYSEMLPIPLGDGFVTQVAFPAYARRPYQIHSSKLVATGMGLAATAESQKGADIEDLAIRDLDSRRAWSLSKGILRPALKYLIERKQAENIQKRYGDGAAIAFTFLSDIYNLASEQADLRSWITLPAGIHITRLELEPGEYELRMDELSAGGQVIAFENLGRLTLGAGETRFFARRSDR